MGTRPGLLILYLRRLLSSEYLSSNRYQVYSLEASRRSYRIWQTTHTTRSVAFAAGFVFNPCYGQDNTS